MGTEAYELTERITLFRRNKLEDIAKRTARPFMSRLLARFEQTVNLAMWDSGQVRYAEILEGMWLIRANPTVDTTAPEHAIALGKSTLAFLDTSEAKSALGASSQLRKCAFRTITSTRLLMKELASVRKQGYSVDNEEIEVGALCVGAPLLNGIDEPFAAISIYGSVSCLRNFAVCEIGGALKQAAKGISLQLRQVS